MRALRRHASAARPPPTTCTPAARGALRAHGRSARWRRVSTSSTSAISTVAHPRRRARRDDERAVQVRAAGAALQADAGGRVADADSASHVSAPARGRAGARVPRLVVAAFAPAAPATRHRDHAQVRCPRASCMRAAAAAAARRSARALVELRSVGRAGDPRIGPYDAGHDAWTTAAARILQPECSCVAGFGPSGRREHGSRKPAQRGPVEARSGVAYWQQACRRTSLDTGAAPAPVLAISPQRAGAGGARVKRLRAFPCVATGIAEVSGRESHPKYRRMVPPPTPESLRNASTARR